MKLQRTAVTIRITKINNNRENKEKIFLIAAVPFCKEKYARSVTKRQNYFLMIKLPRFIV